MKTQRSKTTRLVEQEGLCSVSNNTRWRAVIDAIRPFGCRTRIKYVHESEFSDWSSFVSSPVPNYVEGNFGLSTFAEVEWLEIESETRRSVGRLVPDLVTDHAVSIHAALVETKTDFERTADGFRIFGYRRPGAEVC